MCENPATLMTDKILRLFSMLKDGRVIQIRLSPEKEIKREKRYSTKVSAQLFSDPRPSVLVRDKVSKAFCSQEKKQPGLTHSINPLK